MARSTNRSDAVRRRPRDRKAQIARVSAEAFSELGYYGVTMELIASRVGVSATALYRHYSSKYELFRDAVLSLGQQLVDCTDFADQADRDPQQLLDRIHLALINTALANRESGGLYRWEARLLAPEDQRILIDQMRTVHKRIQRPLRELRPGLTSRQCWTLSTAALSVFGSLVDHRSKLPANQIRALLAELADAVLATDIGDLPDEDTPGAGPERPDPGAGAPLSRYEALLTESMRLFNERGYHATSMEDIAEAVGIQASGIYRYFAGKADILAAAFRRSADRLSADIAEILRTHPDPPGALSAVIEAYVTRALDHPELDWVYYTERLNMSPADQAILNSLQRATVEEWVRLVVALRPAWTAAQARFAVHAAMALVIDVGRLIEYRHTAHTHTAVVRLMDAALLGSYRLRTALPASQAR